MLSYYKLFLLVLSGVKIEASVAIFYFTLIDIASYRHWVIFSVVNLLDGYGV